MRRLIEKRLLRHFGIKDQGTFYSPVYRDFQEDVKFSVENKQMLCLSGDIGSGKSMLFNSVVADLEDVQFVYVRNFAKEKLTISSIINAMIYELSNESPRRDLEARSRQLQRIAGKKAVDEKKQICMVIEEAHRLHANTLRALKELREMDFAGVSPLFSIVVIGHPELVAKLESRKEAHYRSHVVELNEANGWMQLNERKRYIRMVFGKSAIDKTAADRIAALCKVPLEIDHYIEKKMKEARRAGKKVLDAEVIAPSLKELYRAAGISYNEIAKEAGLGKTTVYEAVNNAGHKESDKVQKAIQKLQNRKAS